MKKLYTKTDLKKKYNLKDCNLYFIFSFENTRNLLIKATREERADDKIVNTSLVMPYYNLEKFENRLKEFNLYKIKEEVLSV